MTATAPTLLDVLARYDLPPWSIALSWFGQAGVALRLGGATVLVDPFLSPHPDRLVPPPFAAEEAHGVDLLLITHDHLDHLDELALPAIAAFFIRRGVEEPPVWRARSEERRVGKECRSRWSPYH